NCYDDPQLLRRIIRTDARFFSRDGMSLKLYWSFKHFGPIVKELKTTPHSSTKQRMNNSADIETPSPIQLQNSKCHMSFAQLTPDEVVLDEDMQGFKKISKIHNNP